VRWGMALQEMDLHLHYRPGKTNQNADTLSRTLLTCHSELPEGSEEKVVAALTAPEASTKDGEEMIGLAERQNNDHELRPIIEYLKNGNEEKVARELMLNKKQYVLMDNILYHLVSYGTDTPREDRTGIIKEAHDGKLSGHLCDAKVFGQISKSYLVA